MAILSTGPIENNAVAGVRPTQLVTVKIANRDAVNSSTVLIQGFKLTSTRTLYVLDLISVAPNQVISKSYFANIDDYAFVFTTGGMAERSTQVSVWGKDADENLVSAHRLVSDEILNQN
ncbi:MULTISPECIES: hypothetical protein [Bacillaceae]|uniref:Exosporium protein C n=1 Tax=Metabacillus sediminis TaxID=3117746 RepID=A0ABZ2NBV1_9BACI|nr:hypothetical protein [Bacillus sp. SJS]KZZ84245.1 hypothetical protein AS29_011835 [Bacillus sp. SJS]